MRNRRLSSAVVVVTGLVLAACSSESSGPSKGTAKSTTPPTELATTTTTVALTYTAHVTAETEVGALYRQGVAHTDDGWIFSFNDGLFRTDAAFKETMTIAPAIPAEWKAKGYNHIGDIDVEDGVLYAPLEQPDFEKGTQATLTYDAATLAYKDGRDVAQHENSFVTVDPETKIAYSFDRFGGDALLRYDVANNWAPLEPLKMSTFVDRAQGADVFAGAVWLSTDDATDGVYRVDLATAKVQSLGSIGHVDGEGEGIDVSSRHDGALYVLSIDVAIVPVRLIDLKVTGAPTS
jgi:hypothetical protein